MKRQTSLHILVLLITAGILIMLYIRGRNQRNLREHGVLVEARVIKVLSPIKGGTNFSFDCEFTYNGQTIRAYSPSKVSRQANDYLGKVFPALYAETSGTLQLLLDEDDFWITTGNSRAEKRRSKRAGKASRTASHLGGQ